MDVFLMVRRKKTTIFLDAKETTTVIDLKKMIEGITKKTPALQQLYNKDDISTYKLQLHTYKLRREKKFNQAGVIAEKDIFSHVLAVYLDLWT